MGSCLNGDQKIKGKKTDTLKKDMEISGLQRTLCVWEGLLGNFTPDHFVGINKMVNICSCATREIDDIDLCTMTI